MADNKEMKEAIEKVEEKRLESIAASVQVQLQRFRVQVATCKLNLKNAEARLEEVEAEMAAIKDPEMLAAWATQISTRPTVQAESYK